MIGLVCLKMSRQLSSAHKMGTNILPPRLVNSLACNLGGPSTIRSGKSILNIFKPILQAVSKFQKFLQQCFTLRCIQVMKVFSDCMSSVWLLTNLVRSMANVFSRCNQTIKLFALSVIQTLVKEGWSRCRGTWVVCALVGISFPRRARIDLRASASNQDEGRPLLKVSLSLAHHDIPTLRNSPGYSCVPQLNRFLWDGEGGKIIVLTYGRTRT